MSALDPNHIGYIRTVEQLFLLLRRQGLMLSPKDIEQAQKWAARGIPLRVTCRAIVDAVEHFKETNGEESQLPMTLRYFAGAVEDAAKAHRSQPRYAQTRETVPKTRERLLRRLAEELVLIAQGEEDERIRDAYRTVYRALRDLIKRVDEDESLLPALVSLDHQLVDDVLATLDDAERQEVIEASHNRLAKEANTLGVRGRQERERALLEEELSERYHLFRLQPGQPHEGFTD